MPQLCDFLIQHEGVELIKNTVVNELQYVNGQWLVEGYSAPVLILANAQQINSFPQSSYLPVKTMRGQMTAMIASSASAALSIPVCGEGHILPMRNGQHFLGATYSLGMSHRMLLDQDNDINIAKIKKLLPEVAWSEQNMRAVGRIRAATPDYLPLVGPIAHYAEFKSIFATMATNANRWLATPGPYYPGLYACAGFGSRGLTTIRYVQSG